MKFTSRENKKSRAQKERKKEDEKQLGFPGQYPPLGSVQCSGCPRNILPQ